MNEILAGQLKGMNFAQRRNKVLSAFEISPGVFPEPVTSREDLTREKLIYAGRILFEAAIKKSNNVVKAGAVLDGPMLASTLYDLGDIARSTSSACDVTKARFGSEIDALNSTFNIKVNGLIALREIVSKSTNHGSYVQHFSHTKELWNGSVDYSFPDFERGITIPLLTPNDAFVVGVVCSRGNIVCGGTDLVYKVMFNTTSDEAVQRLVRGPVKAQLEDSFGIAIPVKSATQSGEVVKKEGEEPASPSRLFQVYSRAVTSFYHKFLGISLNKEERVFPNFFAIDDRVLAASPMRLTAAMISGVVSSRGMLKSSISRRPTDAPYPFMQLYLGKSEYNADNPSQGGPKRMYDQFLEYGDMFGLELFGDQTRGKITIGKQAYAKMEAAEPPVMMPLAASKGFFVQAKSLKAA